MSPSPGAYHPIPETKEADAAGITSPKRDSDMYHYRIVQNDGCSLEHALHPAHWLKLYGDDNVEPYCLDTDISAAGWYRFIGIVQFFIDSDQGHGTGGAPVYHGVDFEYRDAVPVSPGPDWYWFDPVKRSLRRRP